MLGLSRYFSRSKGTSRKPANQRRRLQMELLEDRKLLAARVFVDFGDSFSSGTLTTSTSDWVNNAKGGDFRTTASHFNFNIQRFNDVPTVAALGSTAISTLRSEILAQVTRYFEPFDVSVQTASSSTTSGIGSTLSTTDGTSDKDTYIVLGRYYKASDGSSLVTSTTYGATPSSDANGRVNAIEETVSVFVENIMSNLSSFANTQKALGFAYTVAHEAGHAFGLPHVTNPTTAGQSSELMTESADNAQRVRSDNFFSRVIMNAIGSDPDFVPFDLLGGNVGYSSSYPTVLLTGTGGNDNITIDITGSKVTVVIPANGSNNIATQAEINLPLGPYLPGSPIGIDVYLATGFGDDSVSVIQNSNLPAGLIVNIHVIGQTGNDIVKMSTLVDAATGFEQQSDGVSLYSGGNFTGTRVYVTSTGDTVETVQMTGTNNADYASFRYFTLPTNFVFIGNGGADQMNVIASVQAGFEQGLDQVSVLTNGNMSTAQPSRFTFSTVSDTIENVAFYGSSAADYASYRYFDRSTNFLFVGNGGTDRLNILQTGLGSSSGFEVGATHTQVTRNGSLVNSSNFISYNAPGSGDTIEDVYLIGDTLNNYATISQMSTVTNIHFDGAGGTNSLNIVLNGASPDGSGVENGENWKRYQKFGTPFRKIYYVNATAIEI